MFYSCDGGRPGYRALPQRILACALGIFGKGCVSGKPVSRANISPARNGCCPEQGARTRCGIRQCRRRVYRTLDFPEPKMWPICSQLSAIYHAVFAAREPAIARALNGGLQTFA